MGYYFEKRNDGVYVYSKNSLDFDSHLHNHLELAYVYTGTVDVEIDDVEYTLSAGDFLFIFPNQIHTYTNSKNVFSAYCLFSSEVLPEFEGLFCKKIPENPVISNAGGNAVQLMQMLYEGHETMSAETKHGILLALTGILVDKMQFKSLDKYNISTLKNILIYCDEHYKDAITVSDVVSDLHISRSRIAHIFSEKLKTTFTEYISKKRVEYACEMLRSGKYNITETAFASGFGSIRTFNRTFVKYMGMSPQRYKKHSDI